MAKELPYFRFTVSEWLNGDISMGGYEHKGLFADICAWYWFKDCSITIEMLHNKYNNTQLLDDLFDYGVLKSDDENVVIEFLDEQFDTLNILLKDRRRAGRKGGKQKASNAKAKLKQTSSYKDKDKDNNKDKEVYREFAHLSLSKEEFESIKATGYTQRRIDDILDSIENYQGNAKYKSLNLTVRAWLKRDKDKVVAVSNVQPKYEPEPLPETWAPMPASLKKLASKIGKA